MRRQPLTLTTRPALEACGMDRDECNSAGNRDRYTDQVDLELGESRRYGIKGIPAFILDRYLLMGAQPYEVFQQMMGRVQEEQGG